MPYRRQSRAKVCGQTPRAALASLLVVYRRATRSICSRENSLLRILVNPAARCTDHSSIPSRKAAISLMRQ